MKGPIIIELFLYETVDLKAYRMKKITDTIPMITINTHAPTNPPIVTGRSSDEARDGLI